MAGFALVMRECCRAPFFLAVVLLLVCGMASASARVVTSPIRSETPPNKIDFAAYPVGGDLLPPNPRNGLFVSNNPINAIDPTGEIAFVIPAAYYGYAAAAAGAAYLATPAGQQALRDFGRAGAGLLNEIGDAMFNENAAEPENDAVDGGGKSCPSGELAPTGETKSEESTKKGNKGGRSVQEGYTDSQGRPVTRHTIYGPNGNVVSPPHFRPGGFK